MQLHELRPAHKKKKKKRIGRGGKRGTYSGRGQKGQKSRAGRKIRPAERDLLQRIPKLKGVKNKSIRPKPMVINVHDIAKLADGTSLTKKILFEKGAINRPSREVKVLGKGEVDKAFTIEGIKVSKSAKKKIEKAGGRIA